MNKILVPVDLSSATAQVCMAAADLAQSMDAQLLILHVIAPLPSTISGYDVFNPYQVTAFRRAFRRAAGRKMKALGRWFKKRCPSTDTVIHEGKPAGEILRLARQEKMDYIVIGSHRHGAMHDLLIGSTAHLVLRQSPCPVVLVPIPSGTGKVQDSAARKEYLDDWTKQRID